uniref:CUB_2 domain-containing protein n=1 Tax=Caenorhabditis japonica TaxID=281687 RepID=A0A8R1EIT3_CAEJA
MSKTIILLATLMAVAFAANGTNTICKQGNIVNMQFNSKPYYFPSSWSENQTAPQLEKHQSCSWTVTVPQGYYAKLIIDGKTQDVDSRFETIDAAGNFIQSRHEKREPYYFPSPKFTFAVTNGANLTTLGFKIVWAPFPKTFGDSISAIGHMPRIYNATNSVYKSAYSTSTQVSILPFPADPKNLYALRSALVFDGYDLTGSYMSNLYLIAKTRKQFISRGSSIFVINVEPTSNSSDTLYVQNYVYTKDINEYVELNCAAGNVTCSVELNGGSQKSAVVTVELRTEIITNIAMENNATLSIYGGSPNDMCFIATYNSTEVKAALPISTMGLGNQYVISHGKAAFTFNVR